MLKKYKLNKIVIKTIENKNPVDVYDIEVKGDASFCLANGVIAHNSQCSTRMVTGHGIPQLSAIMQCRMAINSMQKNVGLIADGGIRNSGDIVKALAAGADTVMIGNLAAGTNESSGLQPDGTYLYRGMSSKELNAELGKNVAAEGISSTVPAKGPIRPILDELHGGIRSGLSYSNSKNLRELSQKSVAVVVTNHGYTEGLPKHV